MDDDVTHPRTGDVEIPVWVGGLEKWVTGIDKWTTCSDVIDALLKATCKESEVDCRKYVIIERWRKMERHLEADSRILKIWRSWGDHESEVRFTLRRHTPTPRNLKNAHAQRQRKRRRANKDGGDGTTTTLEELVEIIVAQGELIQNQLRMLNDKAKMIDKYEQERHLARMEENGINYVIESYLGNEMEMEVEIANDDDEIKLFSVYRDLENTEVEINRLHEEIIRVLNEQIKTAEMRQVTLEKQFKNNQVRMREIRTQLSDKLVYLNTLMDDLNESESGLSSMSDENQLDTLV